MQTPPCTAAQGHILTTRTHPSMDCASRLQHSSPGRYSFSLRAVLCPVACMGAPACKNDDMTNHTPRRLPRIAITPDRQFRAATYGDGIVKRAVCWRQKLFEVSARWIGGR